MSYAFARIDTTGNKIETNEENLIVCWLLSNSELF